MDLDLLNTFLEVRKTRHFGKAAENLFITQSAVSARIHTLEEALNTRLFERSTKVVNLTDDGEKFAKHAENILHAWSKAKLDIVSSAADQKFLTIGALSSLWNTVLNERLASISQNEQLLLQTLSYSNDDLTRLLRNRTLDLALICDDVEEPQFQHHAVGNLHLRLFMHKNNAKAFNPDLASYIHIDWGKSFDAFIGQQFQGKIRLSIRTDNAQTALSLLKNPTWVTYLPEQMAGQQDDLVLVEKKHAPVFRRKVFACFNTTSEKIPLIKKIVKELQF